MNALLLQRQLSSKACPHLAAIPIRCAANQASSDQQRVYVVFGGYGAIGSALCGVLLQASNSVVVAVGRNKNRLAEVQAHDRVVCDVLDSSAVADAFECIAQQHGGVDGVANCVGNLARSALTTADNEFLDVLQVNLVSCFNILRPAVRTMMGGHRGGSIVFIGAACARVGIPSYDSLAAAKGGVIGLTLGAASSYASHKIRISDGLTKYITDKPDALELTEEMTALKRFGTPLDVAHALEYLLSERSMLVTGQVLGVDGGLASSQSSG